MCNYKWSAERQQIAREKASNAQFWVQLFVHLEFPLANCGILICLLFFFFKFCTLFSFSVPLCLLSFIAWTRMELEVEWRWTTNVEVSCQQLKPAEYRFTTKQCIVCAHKSDFVPALVVQHVNKRHQRQLQILRSEVRSVRVFAKVFAKLFFRHSSRKAQTSSLKAPWQVTFRTTSLEHKSKQHGPWKYLHREPSPVPKLQRKCARMCKEEITVPLNCLDEALKYRICLFYTILRLLNFFGQHRITQRRNLKHRHRTVW